MTIQQDVYAFLTAVLPVIGIILPGIIKSDGLSDQRNSVFTFIILLVFGGAQAWSANQLTGVNPWLDLLAVEAAMASILAGPFKPIDQYLQSNIGLGTAKSTPPTSATQPIPPLPTSQPPQ